MGIGAWVDSKHPRNPAGSPEGGRFTSSADAKLDAPAPLFSKETKKLPKKVVQTTSDPVQLGKDAVVAHEQSLDLLDRDKGIAKALGATIVRGDKGENVDISKVKGPIVMIGPMKHLDGPRAQEKVSAELKGHWEHLSDVVRSSIAVDSHKDIPKVLEKLKAAGIELARQPKDRFSTPMTGSGYRDSLINVRYPNGHVGEIQLHTKALLSAKNGGGHKFYEMVRTIEGRAKEQGRNLTSDEVRAVEKANRASRELYAPAWRASR